MKAEDTRDELIFWMRSKANKHSIKKRLMTYKAVMDLFLAVSYEIKMHKSGS